MGCGGSKVDDYPLVTLCRERKELIRAAAEHRYALASAHISYFRSLKDVGDALRRFVDEELVIGATSPLDSPVLTLPSQEGKRKNRNKSGENSGNNKGSSSSTSIPHTVSPHTPEEDAGEGSHLHLSSGSESELGSSSGHIHIEDSPELERRYNSSPPMGWSPPGMNSYSYYMKSSPAPPNVVYEEVQRSPTENEQWGNSGYAYPGYPYANGGYYGDPHYNSQPSPRAAPPSPPSPKVSAWDFLNPFDSYDSVYPSYYSQSRYGSAAGSSPDSKEVREREGIPDLEDETEQEVTKAVHQKEKKLNDYVNRNSGEGTSRAVPVKRGEDNSWTVPSKKSENTQSAQGREGKEIKSSPDTIVSKSSEEGSTKKKSVSFEEASVHDIESSKQSSMTTLSAHGTRDLQEVVKEIRDEFETASGYGKEVSMLLEVGKLPYQPRGTDEERLRIIYEKKCRRLRALDNGGAESSKIDAAQASIRKLLTKINVCIRAVDAISGRIHKLRDEELQPLLTELIHGLIRMWKSMLKCHQKQFQAILESKTRTLKARTGFRRDLILRATVELEMELLNWCTRFNNWVNIQKSYVESLNGWLLRCLLHVPEETDDGIVPFSPGRIGAPAIFVMCHDWYQSMERISEAAVADALQDFAMKLHQLWDRQDGEQVQRLKADYLSKDFQKRLKTLRMEMKRIDHEQDALSEKTAVSIVASESGISPLDDLRVDLDSMRKRIAEERTGHKGAIKLVPAAASASLQAGLIPIFEALENFTSEALKAHEQVRLQNTGEAQGN
uniref:Nitrate regulatory gene2 protein n=1 Tax=Vitis vinifera TaxID=29760 RepID=F6H0K7_VITVI